jgi:tetratricopeptide (TPR) repeat protein
VQHGRPERAGAPSRGGRPERPSSGARTSGSGYRSDAVAHPRAREERASRRTDDVDSAGIRVPEPRIPDDADPRLLEPSVRAELRSLTKLNAEAVGGHLVAAAQMIDSDPQLALAHARAARRRAARIGAVREAVGIAAYHCEEWAEALTELRTARRITGDARNLPVIADCERALGRPQQALRLLDDRDVGRLDPEARAELFIVAAGARRDMGQLDAALGVLARGGLDRDRPRPGSARLWYVYADILESAGRREDAATWFAASAAQDPAGDTDAVDRASRLL